MHIAICDDNIADRHQLERLLKRESDLRSATSGVLYTDSFGHPKSLMHSPMQYDIFYIDICHTEGISGVSVVEQLMSAGVHAPIVMCCSEIDYRKQNLPAKILFLDKPIHNTELSASIDHALLLKSDAPSMIELRADKETLYVTEDEIVYAVEESRHVTVSLTMDRKVVTNTTAENLLAQIEKHPVFFSPTPKVIVNARYMDKLGFFKLTMKDGTTFRVHRSCMNYAKYAYEEFHNTSL